MLTDKAKRFHQALHDADRRRRTARDARRACSGNCRATSSSSFSPGRRTCARAPSAGSCGRSPGSTLVVAPVLLLLLMQIQFLPFHSSFITWTQRIALLVDLVLVWWLWRKILSGREADGGAAGPHGRGPALGSRSAPAPFCSPGRSATFPGEWQEDHWPSWRLFPTIDERDSRQGVPSRSGFSSSESIDTTRRRWLPFPTRSSCPASTSTKASGSTIPRRRSGGTSSFAPAAAI